MTTCRVFRRLLFLLCLPGCYVWAPVQLTPARRFGLNSQVRVERMDSSTVAFYGPRVVGDSVVGGWDRSLDRPAVALAEVRRAKERRLSGPRTALAGVGAVTGFVFILGAIVASMLPTT